jgi:hypothetical protein
LLIYIIDFAIMMRWLNTYLCWEIVRRPVNLDANTCFDVGGALVFASSHHESYTCRVLISPLVMTLFLPSLFMCLFWLCASRMRRPGAWTFYLCSDLILCKAISRKWLPHSQKTNIEKDYPRRFSSEFSSSQSIPTRIDPT